MALTASVQMDKSVSTGIVGPVLVSQPKANLTSIFGSALFGVVDDLVTAKENGQQLPGILDKIAGVASDAKAQGIDLAKEEAKSQAMKYVPHAIAFVLLIIVIVLIIKRK